MTDIQLNPSAFVAFANTIYDTRDLFRVLDELVTVERSLFKDKQGSISDKARDFLASDLVGIFAEVEKDGMEPDSDAKQLEFLKDLAKYLKNLPQVKLTLAFSPTNTFIAKINSSVSNILGTKVVLDIVVNQYIMGGAIFEYNGKVKTDTLEEKLNSVIGSLIKKDEKEEAALVKAAWQAKEVP